MSVGSQLRLSRGPDYVGVSLVITAKVAKGFFGPHIQTSAFLASWRLVRTFFSGVISKPGTSPCLGAFDEIFTFLASTCPQ